MRKKELRLYIPMLIILVLALGVYILFTSRSKDNQAPEISIDTDTLSVSVTDPESALLRGVTAFDPQDGDVTGLLVVEKISDLQEDHTATITYAAFDHSGNVSKATRTLHYTDYTSPVFSLTKPLVFTANATGDIMNRVTVTDVLDGNISRNLKATLVSDTSSLSNVGTHEVTFRVTNSMGETVRITLPVDVLPSGTYTGTAQLTENLLYIPQGEAFRAADYFKSMTLGSTAYTVSDGVELSVNSDVNTAKPGVYSVTYTATYNSAQAFTRLIVVVE